MRARRSPSAPATLPPSQSTSHSASIPHHTSHLTTHRRITAHTPLLQHHAPPLAPLPASHLTLSLLPILTHRCAVLDEVGAPNSQLDTHLLPAGPGTQPLHPRFTWHGFQFVFVRVSGGATFSGARDAIRARWTTAALRPAASIAFASDGGGELLGRLQAMAEASQLSNMAAYLPTGDSPHCVSLLPTTAIAAAARPSATRTHPRHTHPFR